MRKRVVFLFLVALLVAVSNPVNALAMPVEAPANGASLVKLIETTLAGLLHGSETFVASIESSVGQLAIVGGNPRAGVPPPSPRTSYAAAAAASVAPTDSSDNPPLPPPSVPNPEPTPLAHAPASKPKTVVDYAQVSVASPINIFAVESALDELATRVQALSAEIAAQQSTSPTASVESQIAALQEAVSSQGYNASVSVPLGDGSSNTIAAASNIGQLSGTNISNASIMGGSISNASISGTTVSGATVNATSFTATTATSTNLFATLANFGTAVATTLNTSVANIVGFTATNATTTSLAVTGNLSQTAGTSTLAAVNLPNDNCSSYGNGGKLTTDAFGNIICAADQGGSGSTVAGANFQVQFNDGGSFGANSAFTFNKASSLLTVANASTTNLSVSASATLGAASSTSLFAPIAAFTNGVIGTLNASLANIVGFTATNSTTTNATTTNLYAAAAVIPSLTGTSATFSGATTTNLAVTGIVSSLLKTMSDGAIVPAIAGTDYVASTSGNWTGTFGGLASSYYLDARNLTNFTTPFAAALAATTTDALAQGSTNKYFSNALAQAAISVSGAPLTYSSGVIGISQASGSQSGFLASSDWTNFNGKLASSSLSAAEPLTYNSSTGAIGFDLAHGNTWTGTQTFGSIAAANATTSSLYVTGITSHLLKTDGNGQVAAAIAGTDYQAPITTGNLIVGSNLTVSGGAAAVIGSGASISLGSNVVTAITNDTNVTGSISGNNLTLGWTGLLGVGRGGTGIATTPTYGQLLVGNSGGGYTLTSTSSLGISSLSSFSASSPLSYNSGTGAFSIQQASGSQNGFLASSDWTNFNGKLASSSLATSALVAGLVYDHTGSGALAFATSPTFAGTPVFSGGLISDSVNSTTTIPNGSPYAWTVATSTSAAPLIEVDTSGGDGGVSIGAANASSPNIQLGATGQAANLVFVASSTIEGGGTGQLITIGANADTIAFTGSGNVGIGTTTPAKPLTIDSTSASGTAIRLSNSATGGHVFDLVSTGPNNTGGAGRLDVFDVISGLARLSVQNSGNIGIGTTTPGSIFSINGVANWTTATSTIYSTGGINLTSGCFSISGTCIAGGGGVGLGANTWTGLQTFGVGFVSQASSTVVGPLTVTGTATLSGGLALGSGTTTANNGFNITSGCFSINGTCITGGGGPTYTFSYPLINTANTISLGFGTTTANSWNSLQTFGAGASTTNLVISNLGNTGTNCLQINTLGQVSSTGSACGGSGSTPGGSSGQIQFNSASTFGGASNLWWDSSNNRLGVGTSSPYAELSVATPPGATGSVTTLFAIASSTSVGTTTLFSVDNMGNTIDTLAASSTFAVGANGLTNPAFQILASTTNAANGLQLVSSLAGGGVSLNTVSSGANEGLTISTKGTGGLVLYSSGTGGISFYGGATSKAFGIGSLGSNFTPPARNNAGSPAFQVVTAADTALQASTEVPSTQFNFGQTKTHANGAITTEREFLINAPIENFTTFSASNVITNLATLGITGPPSMVVNANGTAINAFGILVSATSTLNASTTNSYGLAVNTSSGAKNNYAADFLGGNVGIGTTTPYGTLEVWGPDSAASTTAFLVANNASTTEFTVLDNGNATLAGNLIQNSDQRLKTNISDLDGSSSLAEIEALNPVTFNWIDPQKSSLPQFGFIAQQVQQVFPNLVSTTSPTALTPNGTLSLNYIDLISPIIAAIQELDREVTTLTTTVTAFAESITTNVLNAATGHFANQLCVGSTCVTPAQFQAMVAAAANQSSNAPGSSSDATDTPPVIQINGDNPATIQVGASYADLGATITGPQADLNLGIQTFINGIEVSPVQIDTSQAATDTIDYVVTDQNGLVATSTRTVIVQTPAAPSAADPTASTTSDATTTDATQ